MVNFINVKRPNFTYESLFSSYILALNKLSYEKRARKMLMKLTPSLLRSRLVFPAQSNTEYSILIQMNFFTISSQ